MKRILVWCLFIVIASSFNSKGQSEQILLKGKHAFHRGEVLEYRLHYGFITAGVGILEVTPKLYKVNGKICYKFEAEGKSTGSFAMFMKIKDTWTSYVDTTTMLPERFHRNIEEGKYRLIETTHYQQTGDILKVESIRPDKNNEEKKKEFKVPQNVHDIVSGYYYLRSLDFSKIKKGDILAVNAFLENEYYDFKVRYEGNEVVKTSFGKVNGLKFTPYMPKNDLFEGESSIRFWLSDDVNKILLKVQADMFVGAVEMDLKNYNGLKYPINKIK